MVLVDNFFRRTKAMEFAIVQQGGSLAELFYSGGGMRY